MRRKIIFVLRSVQLQKFTLPNEGQAGAGMLPDRRPLEQAAFLVLLAVPLHAMAAWFLSPPRILLYLYLQVVDLKILFHLQNIGDTRKVFHMAVKFKGSAPFEG